MITSTARNQLRKFQLSVVFREDIKKHQYADIQKLYESANVTNKMLVDTLHDHQSPMTSLTDAVFMDIGYILTDLILDNPEIKALFVETYGIRYPGATRFIRNVEEKTFKDPALGAKAFSEGLSLHGDIAEFAFTLFLFYDSVIVMENDIIPKQAIDMDLDQYRKLSGSETDLNDDECCFEGDPSRPVFQSRAFSVFIERQKKALADYLHIECEKLYDFILEQLHVDIQPEDFSYVVEPGEGGIANEAAIAVVQLHKGCVQWVHQMTSDPRIRPGSFGYHPDIEQIVNKYYKARVKTTYISVMNTAIGRGEIPYFEKFHLLRDSKAENPRDDYLAILYLCQVDVIYKMFSVMQEEYYRVFSWEQITHQGNTTRYENTISELNKVIRQKDIDNRAAQRQIENLSARLSSKAESEQDSKLAIENIRLLRQIEDNELRIAQLQQQLKSRDEYIERILTPEEEHETDKIDISLLQSKRYLFVGDAGEALPELRRLFPSSIFMPNATTNISNIQVDAVILLIKWTSHGMYYKVKAEPSIREVPLINVNTKNIDRLLWEMYSHLLSMQ